MDIVYKYLDILGDNFYAEPTMKISVVRHFNDPFEGTTTHEVFEIIENLLKNVYLMQDDDFKTYNDISIKYIESKMMGNGVISLSETSQNLLMWAHYADSHKGMCIGLSPDFAAHKNDNTTGCTFTPVSVTYGDRRLAANKSISAKRFANDLYMSHTLNKSTCWEYEKEQRIILPTHCADRILINETDIPRKIKLIDKPEFEYSIKSWIPTILEQKLLTFDQSGEYYCPSDDIDLSLISPYLGVFEEATFLMLVPPDKIKEIYFGCKVDDAYIDRISKMIKSDNSPLKHIDLYKYKISPNNFELIPTPINR